MMNPSTVQTLPLQLEHVAHVLSVMVKYSLQIVAMLIPSPDGLTHQLCFARPALVGKRACEHVVDLHEGVAFRTPGNTSASRTRPLRARMTVRIRLSR